MIIMKYATKLFTKEEINTIESAISEVEKKTSAEVVPVVASASGRYDRAEDLFSFLLSLLVLGCTWAWFQGLSPSVEAWSGTPAFRLNLPIVTTILVATFFIGIALASRFPLLLLRLPLVAKREMREEVERRARETFQRLKIRRTRNATGILIYVSLSTSIWCTLLVTTPSTPNCHRVTGRHSVTPLSAVLKTVNLRRECVTASCFAVNF